jgi:hypothetical protein
MEVPVMHINKVKGESNRITFPGNNVLQKFNNTLSLSKRRQ